MFDIVKIIFVIASIFTFTWWFSSNNGWQDLVEIYRTEISIPDTFLIAENQRITFKRENKSGVLSLTNLGIGVSDYGLYLSDSSIPYFSDILFPPLLIPWADVAYREIAATDSLAEYYTFYLGNPRITRFSISSNTFRRLEQDYGEPIFINKLGEPE